jgi:zinc and cadmium transporter
VITSLVIYSVLILIASLVGGVLTQRVRVTHLGMQLIMSLVGGLILGVAILHMLPHAIAAAPQHLNSIVLSTLLGVLGMLLLMRLFHVHQHTSDDHGLEPGEDCGHDHHHDHDHNHEGSKPQGSMRWLGLGLGMTVHSLIDGIAVASYVAADQHAHAHEGIHLPGIGIFAAILLHKPLDASSIVWMMKSGGWGKTAILIVNFLYAITTPLGAWLFYAGVLQYGPAADQLLAIALGFSAGVFLCISLSDILPEVQFHSHDRTKLTSALLAGVGLAWGIGLLEPHSAHSVQIPGVEHGGHNHSSHDHSSHSDDGHDHAPPASDSEQDTHAHDHED